jgi:thioredoxin reductase
MSTKANTKLKVYDCIVIGGGPAGLSAGIYLARALRSVLIVEGGRGRTTWNSLNENYFGFPKGIRSGDLARRGRAQAARFGVEFRSAAPIAQIRQIEVPAEGGVVAPFETSRPPMEQPAPRCCGRAL